MARASTSRRQLNGLPALGAAPASQQHAEEAAAVHEVPAGEKELHFLPRIERLEAHAAVLVALHWRRVSHRRHGRHQEPQLCVLLLCRCCCRRIHHLHLRSHWLSALPEKPPADVEDGPGDGQGHHYNGDANAECAAPGYFDTAGRRCP